MCRTVSSVLIVPNRAEIVLSQNLFHSTMKQVNSQEITENGSLSIVVEKNNGDF